ncbi:hypothetical protein VNO80_25273 [Phaseolus coccineus]|uniref:Uncharacterized protein n=1 Tax=Phaseolus coccineus TaxID=3886 RepID=A0AAN9LTZ0_PHACN
MTVCLAPRRCPHASRALAMYRGIKDCPVQVSQIRGVIWLCRRTLPTSEVWPLHVQLRLAYGILLSFMVRGPTVTLVVIGLKALAGPGLMTVALLSSSDELSLADIVSESWDSFDSNNNDDVAEKNNNDDSICASEKCKAF